MAGKRGKIPWLPGQNGRLDRHGILPSWPVTDALYLQTEGPRQSVKFPGGEMEPMHRPLMLRGITTTKERLV